MIHVGGYHEYREEVQFIEVPILVKSFHQFALSHES